MPRTRDGGGRGGRRRGGAGGKRGGDSGGARRDGGGRPRGRDDDATAAAARRSGGAGSGGAGHVEQTERAAAKSARTRPVRYLLEGIGTPAPTEFKPDPFQLEAFAALEHEDVLVTAPTGSGKTWIAREEIRRLLAEGKRAWYTSPLKALTNSKYQEFAEAFGADKVGILTGDRKERADAPLIVGTTEVYRNQLFDALREGHELRTDLVIMDEAHYLADEDRGHVWEEAIILTPPRVRLLLLSATVGKAEEFAAWVAEVRGVHCGVVSRPGARPVPLRAAFLYPDGQLAPLFDEAGYFNHEVANFLERSSAPRHSSYRGGARREPSRGARMHMPEMPPASLLSALDAYDLLPSIVFLPTRRRCDEAAAEAALGRRDADTGRREARRAVMRDFLAEHAEIRKHRHWEAVLRGGVASHHAGHLPAWKLLIEKLMSAGLLDAIFATATVAAGVDFPARTVVLSNMDVRRGQGWRTLTASEFQQMTGRAGRRGRDRVGFIVAAPGTHQDPQKMAALLGATPDPLESQFRATYTTLLNLLDAYGNFKQVREIAARSFAHRETVERVARLETERAEAGRRIERKLREAGYSEVSTDAVRGLERLSSARDKLLGGAPQTRTEVFLHWLLDAVVPGRVCGIGRSSRRLVFVTERREGSFVGVREDGRRASLDLARIGRVYEEVYPLTENARDAAFADVHAGRATLMQEPRLRDARAGAHEAVELINDLMEKLIASAGGATAGGAATASGAAAGGAADQAAQLAGEEAQPVGEEARRAGEEALWGAVPDAEAAERAGRRIEVLRAEVWQPFERRARVLEHFGYLDFARERVTERGRWLADLRLDRPLLVGEAIERNLFASLDAPRAAGLMAALAADAERDYGELQLDDALVSTLAEFERIAYEVASVEWRQGLDPAPEMNFSAAAAVLRWAKGMKWEELVRQTRAEEGDLFRLLSRTGESLMQIGNLRESHAAAARVAYEAAESILREPVRSEEML
ncbi:MAG TPA: DEAD/DEAH box helicase [Pyrinomonadaceae bacterium]|nr:DEAD/DEAH box helicase [Pyrinomonadaceae bacterium]